MDNLPPIKGRKCVCKKAVIRRDGKVRYHQGNLQAEKFTTARVEVRKYKPCSHCERVFYLVRYIPENKDLANYDILTNDPAYWLDAEELRPGKERIGALVGEWTKKANKPADVAGSYVLMIETEIAKQMMSFA